MNFFKFPRTPHLFILPGLDIRDDKVLTKSEATDFLNHEILIEEKVDGANIGISIDGSSNIRVQNRGNYLEFNSHPQFAPLWDWIFSRTDELTRCLNQSQIIFGEWCYAKHSLFYNALPDYFLGFDIYDKTEKCFFSVRERDDLFNKINIVPVPFIKKGKYDKEELIEVLYNSESALGSNQIEGLYFRLEENNKLKMRTKLVKKEFIQAMDEHWSKGVLVRNKLVTR